MTVTYPSLHGLVDGSNDVREYQVLSEPTDLPAIKGLRWLPVEETGAGAEAGAGEQRVKTVAVLADKIAWTWTVEDLPIETLRQAKLAEIEAANLDAKTAPFGWDFGATATIDDDGADAGPAGVQTLQMRGLEDEKNWLAAQAGVMTALLGGAPNTIIPMKTSANLWVQVTALQANAVLVAGDGPGKLSMFQRQAAILARYGQLKKAVADATDKAALDAIDPTSGWA